MATYAIGDIQGCLGSFKRLLQHIDFDRRKDTLWLTGDLVNRGEESLATLRYIYELQDSIVTVLGNHDLHLLAAYELDELPRKVSPELAEIVDAKDAGKLMRWLGQQPLAHYDESLSCLMVHAGVLPNWSLDDVLERADAVSEYLQGPKKAKLLESMYIRDNAETYVLEKKRLRLSRWINIFTRLRFIDKHHVPDYEEKGMPGSQAKGLHPWYQLWEKADHPYRIIFGHWSALGYRCEKRWVSLDSGCVWGRSLTAARLTDKSKLKSYSVSCKSL